MAEVWTPSASLNEPVSTSDLIVQLGDRPPIGKLILCREGRSKCRSLRSIDLFFDNFIIKETPIQKAAVQLIFSGPVTTVNIRFEFGKKILIFNVKIVDFFSCLKAFLVLCFSGIVINLCLLNL